MPYLSPDHYVESKSAQAPADELEAQAPVPDTPEAPKAKGIIPGRPDASALGNVRIAWTGRHCAFRDRPKTQAGGVGLFTQYAAGCRCRLRRV
jgi:hypothetical protein